MHNQVKFYNFAKKYLDFYFISFSFTINVSANNFFAFLSAQLNFDVKYLKSLYAKKKIYLNFKVLKKLEDFSIKSNIFILLKNLEEYNFQKQQYQKIFFVFQNKDYFLLFKPSGVTCQKTYCHFEYTIVDFLKAKYKNLYFEDENFYGLLHRLDKVTSGLLLGNITKKAYDYFKNLFNSKQIEKKYLALISGSLTPRNLKVSLPLSPKKSNYLLKKVSENGKDAISFFKTIKEFSKYSLIEAKIITGRTHQIRAHLSYLKHPIVNDFKYQSTFKNFYIFLHAYYLKFICPITKKEKIFFLEMPDYFWEKIKEISKWA